MYAAVALSLLPVAGGAVPDADDVLPAQAVIVKTSSNSPAAFDRIDVIVEVAPQSRGRGARLCRV